MNININTFNLWAKDGRDANMQRGHASAVEEMFRLVNSSTDLMKKQFNFLDLGCGNGWVVRDVAKNRFCNIAIGVDGASVMIKKAKKLSSGKEKFINADIQSWNIKQKFDIIFSMETFYYFNNPNKIIENIYKNLLNPNGMLIIGIDHYLENKQSLNWDKEYNLSTNTLSLDNWKNFFIDNGFLNLKVNIFGKNKNWGGTLIILGQKL
tara:strand:- start:539 stop:1162 length:624 start_codon:yes stop_codon:yes gene_type:complete